MRYLFVGQGQRLILEGFGVNVGANAENPRKLMGKDKSHLSDGIYVLDVDLVIFSGPGSRKVRKAFNNPIVGF